MERQRSNLQVPSYNMDGTSDDDRRGHQRGGSVSSRHSQSSQRAGSDRGGSGSRPPSDSGRPQAPTSSRQPSEAGTQGPRPTGVTGPTGTGGQPQPPPAQQPGWPAPMGKDPARDRTKQHALSNNDNFNKNLDLPAEAYVEKLTTPFARRPGMGSLGKPIKIQINHFPITKLGFGEVSLYDLSVSGPDVKSPDKVIKKCWNSPTMKKILADTRECWIYNGRNLAWSPHNLGDREIRQRLDLDREQGRTGGQPGRNVFTLTLKRVGTIRLEALKMYLMGKLEWDNHVLECLNFLDHVLRQGPSEKMIAIKRNFYSRNTRPISMGDGVIELIKGTFASITMTQSIQEGRLGLGVTVDVANTCFWVSQNFEELVKNYLGTLDRRWVNMPIPQMANFFKPVMKPPVQGGAPQLVMSEGFKALRKLAKLHFTVKHRGKFDDKKEYTVKNFVFDPSLGPEGANAKNFRFTKKDGTTLTVFDHFLKQYNLRLQYWTLPLIQTSRGGVFPMEVCHVNMHQRYPYKLDPEQTAKMIKFAVTRPPIRSEHVLSNVNELRWPEDKYLRHFKIEISTKMATVPARVIQNPEIQFQGSKINPGVSGRWDLRGKVFTAPGRFVLKNFGMVIVDQSIDKPACENFMNQFLRVFKGHGGKVEGTPVYVVPQQRSSDMGGLVEAAYQQIGNAKKAHPQMLFFVLNDRSTINYERLKKSTDCRWGVISQCMQAQHVRKAQPQYCSNVAMKVNAKLGGQTCKVIGNFFQRPTMIVGVDVSHGAPGSQAPSMAAVTVSMDKEAVRYAATVETNGHRTEVLLPKNSQSMFTFLVTQWCQANRTAPEHVFYFRDGVAEGQFAHVMEFEVKELRDVIRSVGGVDPKITVIVATKRHHIRFFPMKNDSNAGDKNGNPLPGTVVEREVTHPFHYDFYLCSHVAIQGTARPVHYHVIHDEVKKSPDELQKMIYHQCYQYIRSTTPVSIHPAVYYAHLASARGRSHENAFSSDKDPRTRQDSGIFAKGGGSSVSSEPVEALPLLKFGCGGNMCFPANVEHIKSTMWFV